MSGTDPLLLGEPKKRGRKSKKQLEKELMKEYNLGNSEWSWVQFEELNCIANRSNCILSTNKLKNKYEFDAMDEELAIRAALNNILMDE